MDPFSHSQPAPEGYEIRSSNTSGPINEESGQMTEYNFAQLQLLIHALEMLDTSEYDLGNAETHGHLLKRFRDLIKRYER